MAVAAEVVSSASSDLHACQVPSTMPRDHDADSDKDGDLPIYASTNRKGFVGWIASAVRKQIFGSQMADAGGFSPAGPPRTRGSSSDTQSSDRRSLVGVISGSSVRVDRPVEEQAKSANGASSAVYIGTFRNAKGVDMPATIQLAGMEGLGVRDDDLAREAARLQRLRHPNVLRFYGIVISLPGPLKLVMEHCRHGNLRDDLRSGGAGVPLDRLLNWSRQLAAGMAHLEHHGIVHGDLRTQNILMVSIDRCKIANFGLCRTAAIYSSQSSRISFAWASPEAIKMQLVTHQSDVWSFGVTLWEIFSHGTTPWKGLNGLEVLNQIDLPLKIRLPRPKHCPTLVYSLVSLCWKPGPSDRPTFRALESLWKENHPHRARVVAEHVARTTPELTLTEGDLITLVHRVSAEFWYGQNQHGTYGEFPSNHVEQVFLDEWAGSNAGKVSSSSGKEMDTKRHNNSLFDERPARSSSSGDITKMDDISEPFEFNRHISVPSGTCPKEAQRLLEKEFGMSCGRYSVMGAGGAPIYDLTSPPELKGKSQAQSSDLSEYEVVQRIMGMGTASSTATAAAPSRAMPPPSRTGRALYRCPSEPTLMPASMLDNEYMCMGTPDARASAAATTKVEKRDKVEDEYMYMKAGVSRLSPTVTAVSVATATMKKKSPKLKKGPKSVGAGGGGGGGAAPALKHPPTSGKGAASAALGMRARASTLNPTSRGIPKHDKAIVPSTIKSPAIPPKPRAAGPSTGTATLPRQKPSATAAAPAAVGESVKSRIDKLRDRCNSDQPERHTFNRRNRGGTLTADRRSSSVDRLLSATGTGGGSGGGGGGGGGGVQAAIRSLGASDQSLPATSKHRLRKTHSRSKSISTSNASLPPFAAAAAIATGGVLGRHSPRLMEPVSPTSSGYESCGD